MIPLGGLGEVGKNMTVYEYGDDTIVVDAGLAFPRDEHLGVDILLPDFGYLSGRRVRAIVLTHAHEDHVGALPYVLREIDVDRGDRRRGSRSGWSSRSSTSTASSRAAELRRGRPGRAAASSSAPFRLEFVRVAHSVPDCVAIVIETAGRARSCTRATGSSTTRRSTGSRPTSASSPSSATAGVDLMLGDSTNAERPGHHRARSGSSARRSARSSRCGRAASSSPRSPRTSTACSRRSTSPSSAAARSRSSAARCARTSTSPATSATSTSRRARSSARRSSTSCGRTRC